MVKASTKLGQEELKLPNVTFIAQDFIFADLANFDIIYFYHPFNHGFAPLMAFVLGTSKPGTIIISNTADVVRQQIFPKEDFEEIFSLSEQIHIHKFTTYKRLPGKG